MKLVKYKQLPPDGFAGVRMREIIKDRRLFGPTGTSPHAPGIGNLVYLADANFIPHGDTRMHPHIEIDIVTLIVKGRIAHQGSLGDGTIFNAYETQIQRAGGQQILHNEINPDAVSNHLIQLWLLPEKHGLEPEYRLISALQGRTTRVYGGAVGSDAVLPAQTSIDIVRLNISQRFSCEGPAQVYVAEGTGRIQATSYEAGDLYTVDHPDCTAQSESTLIVMREEVPSGSQNNIAEKLRDSVSQS